ncbi:MAG: VWA domain-containing protein [Bacilli bacterium]|nr:VWA domain-containing protein [Bacilli bacterium]
MAGSEENTIRSFNEYLEREKKNSYDTRVSTILFSDKAEYLYEKKNVSSVLPLTKEDYVVGGCTALLDAVGLGIQRMEEFQKEKVLFIIITDGYENASIEYKKDTIKNLIKNHSNWEFIYIGADIDSYSTGGDLGIKKDNIANFKKDRMGTSLLFRSVGKFEDAMMCEEKNSSWKKDLENYIEKNN